MALSWPRSCCFCCAGVQAGPPLKGVGELRAALGQLAVGEMVFWFNRCGPPGALAFPPAAVTGSLVQYCKTLGVDLEFPACRGL